jgi:type VI secretion system secreted protein Hcp
MAFDAYLKIQGIDGECKGKGHDNWIEVLSFNVGVNQPTSATKSSAGGISIERANFDDLRITKNIDKSSPKLALYCAKGAHINEVTLEICRAGGDQPVKFMTYKLTNCIVSLCKPSGPSGGSDKLPTEDVAFNYSKIDWTYEQQLVERDGTGGVVAAYWDLQTNSGG